MLTLLHYELEIKEDQFIEGNILMTEIVKFGKFTMCHLFHFAIKSLCDCVIVSTFHCKKAYSLPFFSLKI